MAAGVVTALCLTPLAGLLFSQPPAQVGRGAQLGLFLIVMQALVPVCLAKAVYGGLRRKRYSDG